MSSFFMERTLFVRQAPGAEAEEFSAFLPSDCGKEEVEFELRSHLGLGPQNPLVWSLVDDEWIVDVCPKLVEPQSLDHMDVDLANDEVNRLREQIRQLQLQNQQLKERLGIQALSPSTPSLSSARSSVQSFTPAKVSTPSPQAAGPGSVSPMEANPVDKLRALSSAVAVQPRALGFGTPASKTKKKDPSECQGERFPDVELVDLSTGTKVALHDLCENRFAVIDFWSTTCPKCPDAVDELEKQAADAHSEVAYICINTNDAGQAKTFVRNRRWGTAAHYHVQTEQKEVLKEFLGMSRLPFHTSLDKRGHVLLNGKNFQWQAFNESVKAASAPLVEDKPMEQENDSIFSAIEVAPLTVSAPDMSSSLPVFTLDEDF